MTAVGRLGLLGGTFDPVHFGHVDAAEAARTALGLGEIRLIPSNVPPHRVSAFASVFHRFALVALAIEGRAAYRVSDMELVRSGLSYTVDTLRALHAEGWAPAQLFFIVGADAFSEISSWRGFPQVLDGAHFVVIARPGTTLDTATAQAPDVRARLHPATAALPAHGATYVIPIEARTRDISSTLIRTRLAAGQPIDDLVPAAVARHIRAHQLYGTADDLHGDN
jgi:nicotinate-nucleotide adenylyltransferase